MSLSVNDYIKYDLYQVFLLNRDNFKLASLRKAYQRQVLIYHPDKFPENLPEEEQKEKMDTFLLINNGYTILANDSTRLEYDEKRDRYLSEEKGFGSLKSQYLAHQKKKTTSPEEFEQKKKEATLLFQQQMDAMNEEMNKHALSKSETREEQVQINKEENTNFLVSEKVKSSADFNNELYNASQNRNIKIENNGTDAYKELGNLDDNFSNNISPKYAFIDQAFT